MEDIKILKKHMNKALTVNGVKFQLVKSRSSNSIYYNIGDFQYNMVRISDHFRKGYINIKTEKDIIKFIENLNNGKYGNKYQL